MSDAAGDGVDVFYFCRVALGSLCVSGEKSLSCCFPKMHSFPCARHAQETLGSVSPWSLVLSVLPAGAVWDHSRLMVRPARVPWCDQWPLASFLYARASCFPELCAPGWRPFLNRVGGCVVPEL